MDLNAYIIFGLLAALYLLVFAYRALRKAGVPMVRVVLISCVLIISFLIGARLLYGILYFEKILENPYKLFQIKLVNFALYGGLIAAFISWYILCRIFKINLFKITDTIVPHLGISLALAKLGCFFNGCCYGKPTEMPWGVVFKNADRNPLAQVFGDNSFINFLFGSQAIPRHPTQLYEVFFALLAAAIAFLLLRKKLKPGIGTAIFLIIYSTGRLISFFFRDFPEATNISNIIRGPVIYGFIIISCVIFTQISRD